MGKILFHKYKVLINIEENKIVFLPHAVLKNNVEGLKNKIS